MLSMTKIYRCIRKQLDGQFISETGDAFTWIFMLKERRADVAASALPNFLFKSYACNNCKFILPKWNQEWE